MKNREKLPCCSTFTSGEQPGQAKRESNACYSWKVIQCSKFKGFLGLALLLGVALTACHKEEQAVAGVAQNAVNAEHKAKAAATERDRQRAALAAIPLPTKGMYADVHESSVWANPFLSVGVDTLDLRITPADANHGTAGTKSRPASTHRQEIQLHPGDLAQALIALPPGAWRYGRVIAVAESPQVSPKLRTKVRRNVEAAIQQLNDLGIVVEEWPTR
jgi:hypothetical protein